MRLTFALAPALPLILRPSMNDHPTPHCPSLPEEAARYALLRRLTPTLRHHMAGEFQPIGMMAALLERRLQQAGTDMRSLKDSCAAIGQLSRQAASQCVDLMTWVAPRAPAAMPAGQAITESVNLLATSLRFRGFALINQAPDLSPRISVTAARSVLTAALLALSDGAHQAADLQVQARSEGGQVLIDLWMVPAARSTDNGHPEDYRALSWDDVQALASAEGVSLERQGDQVRLTLPVLTD